MQNKSLQWINIADEKPDGIKWIFAVWIYKDHYTYDQKVSLGRYILKPNKAMIRQDYHLITGVDTIEPFNHWIYQDDLWWSLHPKV